MARAPWYRLLESRTYRAGKKVHPRQASDQTTTTLRAQIAGELPYLGSEDADELERIVLRLVESLQPECIYAFGSLARGRMGPDSDADLLAIVRESDQPPHRLAQQAYRAIGPRSLALDVLVMTRDAFEWRQRAASSLAATVLREGVLLYAA